MDLVGSQNIIKKNKVISLWNFAKRLRVSVEQIINVLQDGGFSVPRSKPNYLLTKSQINYACNLFVEESLNLPRRIEKRKSSLTEEEIEKWLLFFKRYSENSENLTVNDDFNLIRLNREFFVQHFYNLLFGINSKCFYYGISKKIVKLLVKIKKYKQLSKLSFIFILNQIKSCHVFPIDEEEIIAVKKTA